MGLIIPVIDPRVELFRIIVPRFVEIPAVTFTDDAVYVEKLTNDTSTSYVPGVSSEKKNVPASVNEAVSKVDPFLISFTTVLSSYGSTTPAIVPLEVEFRYIVPTSKVCSGTTSIFALEESVTKPLADMMRV